MKPRERAWGGREECCHAAPPQHLGAGGKSDLSFFVARANQLSNPIAAVDKTFWLCGDAKRQKKKIQRHAKIKLGHLCRAGLTAASTLQRAFVERGAPHRTRTTSLCGSSKGFCVVAWSNVYAKVMPRVLWLFVFCVLCFCFSLLLILGGSAQTPNQYKVFEIIERHDVSKPTLI